MNDSGLQIRKILPKDNASIASVIRGVLVEMGVPKTGTTYADSSLDDLYAYYNNPRSEYYVIELEGEVCGGAGVCPLEKHEGNICELQKMYFDKRIRGRGLGEQILKKCLATARKLGYEYCYLETMPYMKSALLLYEKYGFDYLTARKGDTGHSACPIWMQKKL